MRILQLHSLNIGQLLVRILQLQSEYWRVNGDNFTITQSEYWKVIGENFTITQSLYW